MNTPPPPENPSDNETISVVEELPTENLIAKPIADTSNKNDLSEETASHDLSLKSIFSENASAATTVINGFTCEFSSSSNTYTITGYVGKNRDVVVPATLNGYDVKIDSDAFVNNRIIDTLTISEGVSLTDSDLWYSIPLYLRGSSIRILNLPSTWTDWALIDALNAFQLEAINIASSNPKYQSIDGVVYNKELTELLLYPTNKRSTTLTLPSTAEPSLYNVFVNGNKYLETLNIPDGVKSMTKLFPFFDGESALPNIRTINIGKDLEEFLIDDHDGWYDYPASEGMAAAYPNLAQINVSPDNSYFSSEDGVLYNKDKTKLWCYPPAKKNTGFTAPTSVISVGEYAFTDCRYLKEFIFPSEIYELDRKAFYSFSESPYFVFLNGISIPYNLVKPSFNRYFGYSGKVAYFVGDNSVKVFLNNTSEKRYYCPNYLSFTEYQALKDSNNSKPTTPTNPGTTKPSKPTTPTNQNTAKPSGTWMQDSTGWWYKNADGSYPRNAWAQIGGTWYHFNKSGYMQTGWQQIGGAWYYLKPSGAMATGWTQVGGTWYYLKSSGAMATGWQQIGGTWYYLNTSGAMQTGWYKVGSSWYYSNASGAMQTNRWIGNYYVGPSGAMATSQWVGNYYVDASGLWVK